MNIALARLGLLLFVVEFFPGILLAQVKTQIEDNSYLNIDRNQIAWPSPESVLADLRSSNDDLRLKALRLVGLTDQQSQRAVWVSVNGGPAKIIGQAIAAPERAQLIYAAMGEDTSEAANRRLRSAPFRGNLRCRCHTGRTAMATNRHD